MNARRLDAWRRIANDPDQTAPPILKISRANLAELVDEIDGLTMQLVTAKSRMASMHEMNAWRAAWMEDAIVEIMQALRSHDDAEIITARNAACLNALIAEEWDDGEHEDDE